MSKGGGDPVTAGSGPGPFDATTYYVLTNVNANAAADQKLTLDIESGDLNFSSVINGTPAGAFVAPGFGNPGYVPGTHPGLGDVVGTLTSSTKLGLTGNLCNTSVTPQFTLMNATVDITDTIAPVPLGATNPGQGGVTDNLWSDNGASTTGPGADPPWNAAGGWTDQTATTVALTAGEQTDGLPAHVNDYPDYLNIIFDPDFPLTPGANAVQPLARYTSADGVAGSSVVLDFVIFGPGVLAGAGFGANHPFTATGTIGYTSIAVLTDPTRPGAPDSPISDFCSPLGTTTTVFGTAKTNPCNGNTAAPCDTPDGISNPTPGAANGLVRYRNPSVPGNYDYTVQHQSTRDQDGDGKENAIDACPYDADTYDIRTGLPASEDDDSDHIPDVCDLINTPSGTDQDTDGIVNALDNCPTVANGLAQANPQRDNEVNVSYATAAPAGGPKGDSIGDACDFQDDIGNGAFSTANTTTTIPIDGDTDGDGYADSFETAFPLCDDTVNDDGGDTAVNDGCPTRLGFAETACTGSTDDDADTFPNDGCPAVGTYNEGSGGAGPPVATANIGTNPTNRCTVGVGPDPSTGWPSDLKSGGIPNSTDKITVGDLTAFLAPTYRLNTSMGHPNFLARYDLKPGKGLFPNQIVADDITALLAGSSGLPPMFGGLTRAYNGPVCTDLP